MARTIDQTGAPVTAPRAPRITPFMDSTLLILDGAWRDSKTIADSPRTLNALVKAGLVEKAIRQPTPAYPKPRPWYRLTDAGKARKAATIERSKARERAERIARGLPVPALPSPTARKG